MRNIDRANILGLASGAAMAAGSLLAPAASAAPEAHEARHQLNANGPALSANLGRATLELNQILSEAGPNSCLAIDLGEQMGIGPKKTTEREQFVKAGEFKLIAKVIASNQDYPTALACEGTRPGKTGNNTVQSLSFKVAAKEVPKGEAKLFKRTAVGYVIKDAVLARNDEAILSEKRSPKNSEVIKKAFHTQVNFGLINSTENTATNILTCAKDSVPNPYNQASLNSGIQRTVNNILSRKFIINGSSSFNNFQEAYHHRQSIIKNDLNNTYNNDKLDAAACLVNIDPSKLSISPVSQAKLTSREVWLPTQGCSAYLIENGTVPVGIDTARHCFLNSSGQLDSVTGPNGQPEISLYYPLIVASGSNTGNMTPIGDITDLYITPQNNNDYVIGTFAGQDMASVIAQNQADSLTPEQISQLTIGTQFDVGGMPAFQGTNSGLPSMQYTSEAYIGTGSNINVTNGSGSIVETLSSALIAASVKNNFEDAVVPGDSGSGIIDDSNQKLVAITTAAADFNTLPSTTPAQGEANQANFQNSYGVNLTGYASAEIISQTPPSAAEGAINYPVNVAANLPPTAEVALYDFIYNFANPTYTRNVINGLLYDGKQYINDPAYVYDPTSDTLILAGYNIASQSAYFTYYLNAAQVMQTFSVYPESGQTAPSLITSTGNLTANSTTDSFVDPNGLNIGQTYGTTIPMPSTPPYTVAMNSSGQPVFTAIPLKPAPTTTTTTTVTTSTAMSSSVKSFNIAAGNSASSTQATAKG